MNELNNLYGKMMMNAATGKYYRRDSRPGGSGSVVFDVEGYTFDLVGLISSAVKESMVEYSKQIIIEFETYLDGEPVGGKVREAVRQAIQKAIAGTTKNM